MDRPALNIEVTPALAPPRPRPGAVSRVRGAILSVLLADLPRHKPGTATMPRTFGRVSRIIFGGFLLLPVLLPFVVAALVYLGTHLTFTPAAAVAADPSSKGIYFEPVVFTASDGVPLEGWLVPVVDGLSMAAHRETNLRAKRPAVLLVPDANGGRHQMMPAVKPLREAGFIILIVRPRTCGPEAQGNTFGLKESADVAGALVFLRHRSDVDVHKIAVVGFGVGANAALLAAEKDTELAAVILDSPTTDPDSLIQGRITPPDDRLKWMMLPCKWGFELAYQVDLEDLSFDRHRTTLRRDSVLLIDKSDGRPRVCTVEGIANVKAFLETRLSESTAAIPRR